QARGTGMREGRLIAPFIRKIDGFPNAPDGWELALAYGDARGEAETRLIGILKSEPKNARALLGRAQLRRMQSRSEEAVVDARKAFEASPDASFGATVAAFLAEEYSRSNDKANARVWFRIAVKDASPEVVSRMAFRAARMARETGDAAEAQELLRTACRAGNAEACAEVKGEAPTDRRPLRRRFRN
ncbi:MAG: hypothetical protein ABIT01_20560, partial [Thermoanaerobaculia bacterium]